MYISQVAISFPETAILLVGYPVVPSTGEGSSSETQGQIKGTRESLNGRKNILHFLRATFFRPFRLSLVPTICPWVSEDERDKEGSGDETDFVRSRIKVT